MKVGNLINTEFKSQPPNHPIIITQQTIVFANHMQKQIVLTNRKRPMYLECSAKTASQPKHVSASSVAV